MIFNLLEINIDFKMWVFWISIFSFTDDGNRDSALLHLYWDGEDFVYDFVYAKYLRGLLKIKDK